MASSLRTVLITVSPADSGRFGGRAPDGRGYDLLHHWPEAVGNVPSAPRFSLVGQVPAPVTTAREEAGGVVQRLVVSDWWTVRGVNFARLLRDLLVREVGEHLLAVRRAEDLCDELQPSVVRVPSPLRPGYYASDEMIAESIRLVAQRRGIAFALLRSPSRGLRARLNGLRWRLGLQWTRDAAALRALACAPARNQAPGPEGGQVVCVGPCSAAELQAVQPVANALRARGWRIAPFTIPFYYDRPGWRPGLISEPVVPVGAWGRKPAVEAGVRASEELLRRLRDESARTEHCAAFGACGINLLDSAYLRARLTRLLTVEARLAGVVHESARRMCEALRPAVLLSSKGEGPEMRALMAAAQEAGVPVVFMPHGVTSDDPRWDDIPADLVLADGDGLAEVVARRTGGRVPVIAVGTPKYDAFLGSRHQLPLDRARAMLLSWARDSEARRGPPTEPPTSPAAWIGVAGTDQVDRDRETVAAVAAFAGSCPQPPLVVVKTHPRRSQPEVVRAFQEAAGPTGTVITSGNSMAVLSCCDVVVAGASTAAIEAMAAGRPVVYVGSLEEDMYGYAREGVALHADGPDGVPAILSGILNGETDAEVLIARGKAFAARYLGPLDGHATERAVAAIERLTAR